MDKHAVGTVYIDGNGTINFGGALSERKLLTEDSNLASEMLDLGAHWKEDHVLSVGDGLVYVLVEREKDL